MQAVHLQSHSCLTEQICFSFIPHKCLRQLRNSLRKTRLLGDAEMVRALSPVSTKTKRCCNKSHAEVPSTIHERCCAPAEGKHINSNWWESLFIILHSKDESDHIMYCLWAQRSQVSSDNADTSSWLSVSTPQRRQVSFQAWDQSQMPACLEAAAVKVSGFRYLREGESPRERSWNLCVECVDLYWNSTI